MQDFRSLLANLIRPRLLIRAARHGVQDYQRDRDLKRLFSAGHVPGPEAAMTQLLAHEQELEITRKNGDAGYSIARHVDLLIALMAEVRLIAATARI